MTTLNDIPLNPAPFAELLSKKEEMVQTFEALESAIMRSFAIDAQRNPLSGYAITRAEMLRRFKLCENFFRKARAELGMSLPKTLDLMAHALRCELDGIPYDPTQGLPTLWTPT